MYIIIPVIIITIIVAISFGASNFRNVNLEDQDASSLTDSIMNFLDINLTLGDDEENQETNDPPVLQEP